MFFTDVLRMLAMFLLGLSYSLFAKTTVYVDVVSPTTTPLPTPMPSAISSPMPSAIPSPLEVVLPLPVVDNPTTTVYVDSVESAGEDNINYAQTQPPVVCYFILALALVLAFGPAFQALYARNIKKNIIQPQPETQPELETQLEPQPEPQPETQPESDPETQPQLEPETQLEPQPVMQPETQLEPQPQLELETQPESEPETQLELELKTQPGMQLEPQPETQLEPQPKTQLEPRPEMQLETQPVMQPETQLETQPKWESESQKDALDKYCDNNSDTGSCYELIQCPSNLVSTANGGNMLGVLTMDNNSQLSIASGSRTLAKVNRIIAKSHLLHRRNKLKASPSISSGSTSSLSTSSPTFKKQGRTKRAVNKLIHLSSRVGRRFDKSDKLYTANRYADTEETVNNSIHP
ncbi:hypothetical protein COEREDRAFT_7529 [Coemansia reversa NRRL 1564]|uniref:Uncharacterized protein n=1 Tax=Coemansia reversa (strain ATCC 12441 / NRRL 1564) TaxID=763665 RepID=A0A2G5BEW2_COERN|nr:hypothetical protein COEREDRAFT_7529 [Coemansia reversa NRRL 1564]|eukprot:PIA17566.1 hypothetical protein COEREDRAFT_7529 [Coemansia reversa NRRL 1564]